MSFTILTPIDLSDARKVGKRRFRKQILAFRELDYQGRKINFDLSFMKDVVRSFKTGAYDQVPFVLANEKNEHHMDPKLFEGEMVGVELTDDGLDAVLELTPEGATLVEKNPRLGVSARIVQGLVKNGRTYNRAIQHVLATMDPRMTGLRPWQAIDLSVFDNSEVVDLTAETYKGKAKHMPKSAIKLGKVDAKAKTATLDLSSLSDSEFEALIDLGEAEVEIDPKTGKPVLPPVEGEGDEVVPEDVEDEVDEEDEVDPNQPEQHEAVTAPPATPPGKTVKRKTTVEEEAVAPPAVAELSNRMNAFEAKQAEDNWGHRRALLENQGVPPFALDLAEPILSSPQEMVIDLSASGGAKHDPKDVINKLLDGYVGAIDLSPEMGHAIDLTHTADAKDPDAPFLAQLSEMYGD